MIRRSDAVLSSDLGTDVVAMDIEHGTYFGLESVAGRIWTLLAEPTAAGAVCDRLAGEYEVSHEQCDRDVLAFMGDMLQHQIIQIDASTSR
ncbi:MAG: PqqD family peptide modification chaperone [bacterium]